MTKLLEIFILLSRCRVFNIYIFCDKSVFVENMYNSKFFKRLDS